MRRIHRLFPVLLLAVACSNGEAGKDVVFTPPTDTKVNIGDPDAVVEDTSTVPDETAPPDLCQPQCEGLECGDDGCGGSCGECAGAQDVCTEGLCVCFPACGGISCGSDGCGGSCGECTAPLECVEGSCICQPQCDGKECGPDGCNGSCGTCPGAQDECVDGICVCQPECNGKNCGNDGCGSLCGECSGDQEECLEGLCTCVPACDGLECGDDGCGGVCGECSQGDACFQGACCTPQCDGLECGDDQCGSVCGECLGPQDVCQEGLCVCIPDCNGKVCGSNGCDGTCGDCLDTEVCNAGTCCTPDCDGKLCGDNACGGMCGNGALVSQGCEAFQFCDPVLFVCQAFAAPDMCDEKECGLDGLGGSCGLCPCPGCTQSETNCEEFQCVAKLGLDCQGIFDCFDDCFTGDQACYQNCVNSGDLEAQLLYNGIITCLDDVGYFDCPDEDDACLEETFDQCMTEYYECFHGDEPCASLYICLMDCPGNDSDCSSDCFANGTIDALALWDQFIDCLQLNGYFDCEAGDDACYDESWEACDAEFTACANGNLDCQEVFGCIKNCDWWDSICPLGCRVNGTIEVQAAIDDIGACVEEVCDPVTGLCEQEALLDECADTYAACLEL